MTAKEQSPGKKGSESKRLQRPPEVELDPQEHETLLAAETVQRFADGHHPPLTPGHVLALQRKAGNTAVQRLIDGASPGQDRQTFRFGDSRRRQGGEAPSSAEIVPNVQRQGGGGAGGAGGGTADPDSGTGGGSGSGQGTDPEGGGPVAPPAPGKPVKFGLAGSGVSFSLEGGEVAVGYQKSDDIISKTVGPLMVPLATGVGIVMSASLKGGLSGGGSVKGSVQEDQPGPNPRIMQETATFDASIEFKIGITGEVFFGLGVGVQAANFATGIAGSLEFATKYTPRVSGYAIRYSYPEEGGQSAWDEWAGEITMEQSVRSEIVAQLKTVGRWHLFTESGDWFVVDIGNWPIYEIYSVGMTKYGMPDGDVSTSLDEGVKFLGVPMEVADSGRGKPPWEFEGQEGAGPVGPGEGSGGASAEGRQGGSGGYGPASVGEISEGEDIVSGDEPGVGGAGGGSQEEGMLSGGGESGVGGGSLEQEMQSSAGQGGAGGAGGGSYEE